VQDGAPSFPLEPEFPMSIHRSLKIRGGLTRARNVWTRIERLEALKKAKRYEEGDSVFGLPKVRTGYKQRKKAKKKKEEEQPAEGAAPAEGEATPPAEAS
jgi:small basic protein (TIGR04137 family)